MTNFYNDHIYCEITKGIYGLPQAAVLSYQQLCIHLASAEYHPIPGSGGMLKHEIRPTVFCLCVDDFSVKSFSKNDTNHLISTIQAKNDSSID